MPWESVGHQRARGGESGEIHELPEDPQGQDSCVVLGSGAGGGREGAKAVGVRDPLEYECRRARD